MSTDTEYLEKTIAHWEKVAKQAAEVLSHSRAALAAATGNGAKTKAPVRAPFTQKYSMTAHELVLELLGRFPKGLSVREVRETLAGKGFEFAIQAISLQLESLVKKDEVLKVRAPKGSKARFVYKLARKAKLSIVKAGGK